MKKQKMKKQKMKKQKMKKQKMIAIESVTNITSYSPKRSITKWINPHVPNKNIFLAEESIATESYNMLKSSFQISFSMIAEVCIETITAIFFGHLQDSSQILAATSIAKSFVNITCCSIVLGFTSALWTLVPQAIGSNNTHLITLYAQRGFIVSTLIAMPLSILMFYSKNILMLIGVNINNEISWSIISNYCISLVCYIYPMILLYILHRITQNLNYNFNVFVVQSITFVLSIPLNYLFIIVFDFGYVGGAVVYALIVSLNAILIILFLMYKGYSFIFKPLPFAQICDSKGLQQYIRLGFSGCIQCWLVWNLRETMVILTGYAANSAIAISCTAIMAQINFITLIHNGLANAFTIRIGQYIGGNKIYFAKRCIKIQMCFAVVLVFIFAVICILFKHNIAMLFTNNEKIIELIVGKFMYVCVFDQFIQAMYRNIIGVYRALGYQKMCAGAGILTQYAIIMPIQLFLLFGLKYIHNMETAIYIIWVGTSFGKFLTFLVLVFILTYYIDWEKAVEESKLRIKVNNDQYYQKHTYLIKKNMARNL
eukprot:12631_1